MSVPWRSKHAVPRAELASRLARALSGTEYSGDLRFDRATTPEWFGEGWDCDVFRAQDATGTPWLCKIPKHPEAQEWIRKEAGLLEELEAFGESRAVDPGIAPRLGARGLTGTLPFEWIVVSIAPGRCVLDNLSLADPELLGGSYGRILKQVHALVPRSLDARHLHAVHRVDRLVETAPRTIELLRAHVDEAVIRQIEAMVGRAAGHTPEEVPAVFIHADVFPEHVFIDPVTSRITCLIDWADACWGDIADDFAMPGWYLGETFVESAIAAYRENERLDRPPSHDPDDHPSLGPGDTDALRRRIYRLGAMIGIEDIRMAEAGAPNAPLQLRLDVLRARAREGWLEKVGS